MKIVCKYMSNTAMEPVGASSGIPRTRFPAAYFSSMSVLSKQSPWFGIQKHLARILPIWVAGRKFQKFQATDPPPFSSSMQISFLQRVRGSVAYFPQFQIHTEIH